MQDLMKGKRGLVMGFANDHSIAWGIAKTLAGQGAELRLHLSGRRHGQAGAPAGREPRRLAVLPCDVENLASVDEVFRQLKDAWAASTSWCMRWPSRTSPS